MRPSTRVLSRRACAGLAAAGLLAGGTASAEPAHAALRYERGPDACPTEDAFRRQVMARLGYDPFVGGDGSTSVAVKFSGSAGGLSADVSVTRDGRTSQKQRSGRDETCDALAESVATTLAMALDPIAASSAHTLAPLPSDASPPANATPPPAPAADPKPPVASADGPEKVAPGAPPWSAYLGATVGAGVGELPGAALDGSLGFDARRGRWGLLVDLRGATTPSAQSTSSGDRVDASVVAAGPGGCVHGAWISGCAHARFGSFGARAENVVAPADVRTFYAEVAVSARARLSVMQAGELHAMVELLAPLRPSTLRVGPDEAWSAPPVSARLGVGGAFQVF